MMTIPEYLPHDGQSPMFAPYRRLIAALVASIGINVTAGQQDVSREVVSAMRERSLGRHFVRETNVRASRALAVECLAGLLANRGATILAADANSGLISWFDLGGGFVALSTIEESSISGDFGRANRGGWSRTVYGSARVHSVTNVARVTVFIRGRESCFGPLLYSDGTYERKLLAALEKEIYRASQGVDRTPSPSGTPATRSGAASPDMPSLAQTRFTSLRKISPTEFEERIPGSPYSVFASDLWTACLDVLCQYDVVVSINADERIAVAAKTIGIPVSAGSGMCLADVLLAVHVAGGTNGTAQLYIGVLSGTGLPLMPIQISRKQGGTEVTTPTDLGSNEQGASLAGTYFQNQVDTQLFHRERWRDKKLD